MQSAGSRRYQVNGGLYRDSWNGTKCTDDFVWISPGLDCGKCSLKDMEMWISCISIVQGKTGSVSVFGILPLVVCFAVKKDERRK